MKEYYVEEFKNKESYLAFIRYMLLNSDTFSLIYFKYIESEKTKKSVKEVKKALEHLKIYSCNTLKWPGTETTNNDHHIYRMIIYNSLLDAEKVLNKVEQIYEWQYPQLPMDLCFYKNGYAWFASCAHENLNWLYTNEISVVEDLKTLGVDLFFRKDVDESILFYNNNAIINNYQQKTE